MTWWLAILIMATVAVGMAMMLRLIDIKEIINIIKN
jgi:hypothetical protein